MVPVVNVAEVPGAMDCDGGKVTGPNDGLAAAGVTANIISQFHDYHNVNIQATFTNKFVTLPAFSDFFTFHLN